MQIESAVRLVPMQKHRDADDSDVGEPEGDQGDTPPGEVKNT
jgi:hypothetical protein